MQTICFMNQKGGVGKTTCACSIAGILKECHRVLLIDMDAQASLSLWLGHRDDGQGLLRALLDGVGFSELVRPTAADIDLIPSGGAMQNFGKLAAQEPGSDQLLRVGIGSLPKQWDFILIDCGPAVNLGTVNSLSASRYVVVPVLAEALSIEPLGRILETIRKVQTRLNPSLELLGIVPSRVDTRTRHAIQVRDALAEKFGKRMLPSVRASCRVAEASGFQRTISEYDPGGAGDTDYRVVTKELLRRMKDNAKERVTG